jgi:hypothetical protein
METETTIETAPVETITFEPPIQVNPNVIAGDMVVSTADVIPQDDPNQVVAAIYGDGRVIGVPFVDSNENSLRVALS